MADLTERLLSDDFEEALKELEVLEGYADGYEWVSPLEHKGEKVTAFAAAIRTLHRLLATAKSEGAAEALDEASQYFYDEGLPGSLALKDRAAAIRKGIEAKEGK